MLTSRVGKLTMFYNAPYIDQRLKIMSTQHRSVLIHVLNCLPKIINRQAEHFNISRQLLSNKFITLQCRIELLFIKQVYFCTILHASFTAMMYLPIFE